MGAKIRALCQRLERTLEEVATIVQRAIRSAATASTPSGAIDLLGEALLEPEHIVAQTSAPMH